MANILIVVGSVTGKALSAANAIQSVLATQHQVTLSQTPIVADITRSDLNVLLVVSSTTGQGEIPAPLQPWFSEMQDMFPLLPGLKFAVVGLGDSSYANFCGGSEQIENLLSELQAKPICDRFKIDALEYYNPVDVARQWALEFLPLIS